MSAGAWLRVVGCLRVVGRGLRRGGTRRPDLRLAGPWAVGVLCLEAPAVATASPEAENHLGAQERFTLDPQGINDRSSLAVNVANGDLIVGAT